MATSPSSSHASGGLTLPVDVTSGDVRVQIATDGLMTITGANVSELVLNEGDSAQSADLDSAGNLTLTGNSPTLSVHNIANDKYAGVRAFCLVTGTHAAPANGDLFAGDCLLWFDQTNGAAKLMAKAKTADGTVVTASVALA